MYLRFIIQNCTILYIRINPNIKYNIGSTDGNSFLYILSLSNKSLSQPSLSVFPKSTKIIFLSYILIIKNSFFNGGILKLSLFILYSLIHFKHSYFSFSPNDHLTFLCIIVIYN